MEVVERGPCFSLAGLETDEKVVAAGVQKQVGDLRALEIVRLENIKSRTIWFLAPWVGKERATFAKLLERIMYLDCFREV